tara:strand:- start:1068 stop:1493 length:426 start_codon:yes stop_codon:yes gene_type:complete
MKIKIESNFSFKKLADKVDDIIDKYKEDASGAYADGSRKRIDDKIAPSLQDYTKRTRTNKVPGFIPLKDTGRLYKSLKGTKKGLEMLSYGLDQHRGMNPNPDKRFQPVPARPFFGSEFVDKKGEAKAKKSLVKNIRKGMKI